ncbi:MAG: class I SAM-dependent methyltransferase [Candidatus Aenigmarchaeota archaeon]|nr:class I SAM-dependent methyltransferase [Candidatus Aenigmarchaeota archaeon]
MKDKITKFLQPYYKKVGYDQKYEWDKIALIYMKNCEKILDLGCGIGRFIEQSPERIVGVDYNESSIEICKRKGFNVKKANATKLPFGDSSFDGVHCSHVIEHLYPKEAHLLLTEMNRVLKKKGILCIRTPLLYGGFYKDFTHIKPYYPEAILHYLKIKEQNQRTSSDIHCLYKFVKLKYRRPQLFSGVYNTFLWFLYPFFNILCKVGITSFKKTGYMLILEKIE